jgi:hypothetical protein
MIEKVLWKYEALSVFYFYYFYFFKVITSEFFNAFFRWTIGQGAGKSAVLNSLIGHPVLVSHIWFESLHS